MCWVPQQFTEEHQKNCMRVTLTFLIRNKEDGDTLLEEIINSDESWIHFYKPERKSASMVWKKKWKCRESSRMSGPLGR